MAKTKITELPIVKISDLPKDTVVRIDPDFEAPGIEWRKKSICEAEDSSYVPFETTGLISGQGLTTILEEPLSIDATSDDYYMFNAQATVTFQPNNDFMITDENGEMLVKLDMKSGDVEYGEQYCLNDAARIFWDAIGTYRQPDVWEENENLTSTQVLVELRNILGVNEGEDILATAKQMTNNQITPIAAPGCLDDMPESYFNDPIINCPYIPESFMVDENGKRSWRAKTQEEIAFDDAMKVIN